MSESVDYNSDDGADEHPAPAQSAPAADPAPASEPKAEEPKADEPKAALDEWDLMEVPEDWRPRPIMRVWGVSKQAGEGELRAVVDAAGFPVHSVAFEPKQETPQGKVAFVRLQLPPRAPSAGEGAAPQPEPDAAKLAEAAVKALRSAEPKPQLRGAELHFERTAPDTTLFLTSLPPHLESDPVALRAECERFGALERCFVVRNPGGDSKGYAFCEYSIPSAAAAAGAGWYKESKAAHHAARQAGRQAERAKGDAPPATAAAAAAEDEQQGEKVDDGDGAHEAAAPGAKHIRAEVAPGLHTVPSLFGRTLYLAGLPPSLADLAPLRAACAQHGALAGLHAPRSVYNPQQLRGFAFVQYRLASAADAAFRALSTSEIEGVGKLTVSFANPAKAQMAEAGTGASGARGPAGGGYVAGGRGRGRGGMGRGYGGAPGGGMTMGMAPALAMMPPMMPMQPQFMHPMMAMPQAYGMQPAGLVPMPMQQPYRQPPPQQQQPRQEPPPPPPPPQETDYASRYGYGARSYDPAAAPARSESGYDYQGRGGRGGGRGGQYYDGGDPKRRRY